MLGKSCRDVECEPKEADQAVCTSDTCDMTGFLERMQQVYPQLKASNVTVTYKPYPQTIALGFVGRPGGVPVEVTVSIRCRTYNPRFLSSWFDWALPTPGEECEAEDRLAGFPIPPSTTRLSSESLGLTGL